MVGELLILLLKPDDWLLVADEPEEDALCPVVLDVLLLLVATAGLLLVFEGLLLEVLM
jgi:hypothetical protein